MVLPRDTDILRGLDEAEKLLYERLRLWRKEESAKADMPAYMLARNSHLVQMVKQRCQTLESFKGIKGFGKKGIQKYGKQIIEIIKGFYESGPAQKSSQNLRLRLLRRRRQSRGGAVLRCCRAGMNPPDSGHAVCGEPRGVNLAPAGV